MNFKGKEAPTVGQRVESLLSEAASIPLPQERAQNYTSTGGSRQGEAASGKGGVTVGLTFFLSRGAKFLSKLRAQLRPTPERKWVQRTQGWP